MPSFSLSRCLCCFSNKQSAKVTADLGLVQVQEEADEEVGQPVPPSDELSGPDAVAITVEVNTESQTPDKSEDQPTCQTASLLESEAQSESKPLAEAETVVAAAEETLKVTASGDDERYPALVSDAEAEDEEEYVCYC